MEEKDNNAKSKAARRAEGLQILQQQVEEYEQDHDKLSRKLRVLEKVLGALVLPGPSHGSSKPETTTWKDWFEKIAEEPLVDCPTCFDDRTPTFENVIVLLSTCISLLRKDADSIVSKKNNMKARVAKRKTSYDKMMARADARVKVLIQRKEEGTEEAYLEKNKFFGEIFKTFDLCTSMLNH